MLVDTGSSETHVPSEIFGNPNGEVYISSLWLENGLCFNNFMAQSSNSAFTQNKQGYFNGIIGIDLLKNFDVTFDYKNELIYVIEDGFAWLGGLREGDEIISVNGIPIGALGYFGIYELLADTSIGEYQFLILTPGGDVKDVIIPTE